LKIYVSQSVKKCSTFYETSTVHYRTHTNHTAGSILRQIHKAPFLKPYSKTHLNFILQHMPRQVVYADPTHMILVIL